MPSHGLSLGCALRPVTHFVLAHCHIASAISPSACHHCVFFVVSHFDVPWAHGPCAEVATHDISKNQWDNEPVDRPLCSYLKRKAAVKKPTTADLPLRYKACIGQDWVGQGPMVALAAAQLEHIVPHVTHPTK